MNATLDSEITELRRANAELQRRLDEALARETATAEVLQIINSSSEDLGPVFDAMLEKALRLCEAAHGHIWRIEGEHAHAVAARGDAHFVEAIQRDDPAELVSGRPLGRLARGENVVHMPDATKEEVYRTNPAFREFIDASEIRTAVMVALRKDETLLGAIVVHRREVLPFTHKQIVLLQNFASQAVIAIENARLLTETREALKQQTATAEVLQVINSSPGDLAPVFQAIVEKAHILCGAVCGSLQLWDGEKFRGVAMRGFPEPMVEALRQGYSPGPNHPCRCLIDGTRIAHCADMAEVDDPVTRLGAKLSGIRTVVYVALRKDDALLGQIVAGRLEVRPFTDTELALLQNFAAQAVIAMENARLLSETREALEQQTATAEVLQVINSSPGDFGPVFDAILEKAHRLCGAALGSLGIYDGETWRAVVQRGYGEPLASKLRQPARGSDNPLLQELIDGAPLVHVADLAQLDHPIARANVAAGVRTLLVVALRKEDALLGTISIARRAVRQFSDKEIALLKNFAAQAVIAMENARLLTETREALEQQTATAEVLRIINSSPGNLTPVFEAILDKAHTLCGATRGTLFLFDGVTFRAAVTQGCSEDFANMLRQGISASQAGFAMLVAGARLVHIPDLTQVGDPVSRAVAGRGGVRTNLLLPLRKDDTLLGVISCNRGEVRPFSDNEIALLQNFAAQAVIAIENARLITETREALDQQTATAEVLGVINSSPGDLAPVFDAMLEKAMRLCEASHAHLFTLDGEEVHPVAARGDPRFAEWLRQQTLPVAPGSSVDRLRRGEPFVHVLDAKEMEAYRTSPSFRELIDRSGCRSAISLPLCKDNRLLGTIHLYRPEVRLFSETQIALLQNFASQAVIAMENARLLTETREALEQQTATAEVLQVINSSPGDLAPVFDAMLDKAMRLCEAVFGEMYTFHGDHFRPMALRGVPAAHADFRRRNPPRATPGTVSGRIASGTGVVHVADLREEDAYRRGDPSRRALVDLGGARTALAVALRKDNALLGMIMIYRQEVRPFSDKQIALLQNFAAQAVIAMENARLLTETREALEQQTATAEVLQVINSSPGDLAPVFDAMLERAMRLCEAAFGMIHTFDGTALHLVARRGIPPLFADFAADPANQPGPSGATPRLIRDPALRFVHVIDLKGEEAYRSGDPYRRALVDIGGARTLLAIPLRKDGVMVGVINIYRQEVRAYTEKEIAVMGNFAAQAVIAMENARLLDEIRQRQQELRVTFDNMVDGVAMFDEVLRLAAWNRNFQELLQLPEGFLAQRHDFDTYIRYLTERGEFDETDPERQIQRLRARIGEHYSFERTRPDGTVIEVRHNPMPGGGIVLIYSDVTERKRSEQEIRAARDAAEAAYRDLKAAQASLIQAEKMASLGQLTAGIAHEIKNPLNFVNNFAGLSVELLDELKETAAPVLAMLDPDKRADLDETMQMLTGNLEKIGEHGQRADNIVKSMLEHSRGVSGERRAVDLNGLVEEALNLAYHGARARDQSFNITLERDYAPVLKSIELAPQEITRVFLNLFGNGFYAARKRARESGNGSFPPILTVTTREEGEAVEVKVRDNGSGIAPEIRDRLFQPFFTTKPTGEGTGLGLSISYDIVTQQHGGTITVESQPGAFTEFTVRLPRTQRTTAAAS